VEMGVKSRVRNAARTSRREIVRLAPLGASIPSTNSENSSPLNLRDATALAFVGRLPPRGWESA
jgi:hypothetical protein